MTRRAPKFPMAFGVGALIKRLRLNVIIHSCMYYELDHSIISDAQFDRMCKQLVALIREHPHSYGDRFDKHFVDWDGVTGYDFPHKDEWVLHKANYLIKLHEQKQKEATHGTDTIWQEPHG